MFIPGGIDHLIRDIGLVLSITFVVPLIGAVAGTIAGHFAALQARMKGTGQQNG